MLRLATTVLKTLGLGDSASIARPFFVIGSLVYIIGNYI
jgi:hypothetical protein